MVHPARFERATPGSEDQCSIQLSYGRLSLSIPLSFPVILTEIEKSLGKLDMTSLYLELLMASIRESSLFGLRFWFWRG